MLRTESRVLSRKAAYYGLSIVTLLNLLNYIDRMILAAVLPRIKSEMGLSDFQLGLLANAFLVAYFATSPIFGAFGDRVSRSRLMAAAAVAWSFATAAAGMAQNFVQLLLFRAGVGVGEAAYTTISPALLSDYFPRSHRGRAFAVFYVAIPVGSAIGFLLGGQLERAFGWRAAFYAVGLPGTAMALLALTVPDPARGTTENEPTPPSEPASVTIRALLRNFAYAGTVLGYAAYTFGLGGLAYYLPTYFERVRGMELSAANTLVGAVTVVAGLAGTFAGGYLGDRLSTRLTNGQLWICGISSIAAIIPTWLTLTSSTYLWFFAAEFLLFLSTGPVNVVIVNVVPASARAMAMALSIFAIHLLGDAISPLIIGKLADLHGLAWAVLIVPIAIAVSGLLWTGTAAAAN